MTKLYQFKNGTNFIGHGVSIETDLELEDVVDLSELPEEELAEVRRQPNRFKVEKTAKGKLKRLVAKDPQNI
jgi:hypothetical protein